MKKSLLMLLFLGAMCCVAWGQSPALDIILTVTDGAGGTTQLRFGLDPAATDVIDPALGEAELPPSPPSGVFDARFIGDDITINIGQGSLRDYRQGSVPAIGTRIHELKYQVGSGTSITIGWNLPAGARGRLQDLILGSIVDVAMSGTGNFVVTNPGAISKLKLTATYSVTAVRSDDFLPTGFRLEQNYPNPFNPVTTIAFSVPREEMVALEIYDELGRMVQILIQERFAPGNYHLFFDASKLASGVYIYRMVAGSFTASKKLTLIR